MTAVNGLDFVQIISLFIVYFLGGYLLYACFFAAIGSAVDNETDTQQFSMLLCYPLSSPFMPEFSAPKTPMDVGVLVLHDSVYFAIVMVVRLPFDVPFGKLLYP